MNSLRLFEVLSDISKEVKPIKSARVTAALVSRGEMIAVGFNQYKSHPLQSKYSKNEFSVCLHAEIDAIRKVKDLKRLSHCILYVCRVRKIDGEFQWGLAKPCKGCMSAIYAFNIKRVLYTINSTHIEWDEINLRKDRS